MNKQRRRKNRKGVNVTRQRLARSKRHSSRRLLAERLEDRRLLTTVTGDVDYNWNHNYHNPEDVNGDYYVSPRDALTVITELNTTGARELPQDDANNEKIDTNNDGFLSPIDALLVVDTLNDAEGNGGAELPVAIILELQDADGNALTDNRVKSGDDFRIQISLQDRRDGGTGLFSAFLDVAYSNDLASTDYGVDPDTLTELFTVGGFDPSAFLDHDAFQDEWVRSSPYEVGNPYANPWRWWDAGTSDWVSKDPAMNPDEFDEMGASSPSLTHFAPREIVPFMNGLLTADLQFDDPGTVTFVGQPADLPTSDVLFSNDPNNKVDPLNEIEFNSVSVTIYKPVYARNDEATTDEDTPVTIAFADNDSLDITSTGLALQSFTQPSNGTVTVVNGQFEYRPDADYNNDGSGFPDTFTYVMRDADGNTDEARVSVTVNAVNDDPIANPDSETVAEDPAVAYLFDVLANDKPGPPTALDEASQDLTLVSVGTSQQGATVAVNAAENKVEYTPPADFFGTDTFTYVVEDSGGATSTGTVTVTVTNTNDSPVAVDDSFGNDGSIKEDLAGASFIELDVLANDLTDVDPAAEKATFTILAVGEKLNGTSDGVENLGVTANGGTVIISGGKIRYTPATDYFGTDTFVYQMSDRADGSGLTDFAAVSVVVTSVNDAPTASDAFLEAEEREAGDPGTELDVLTGLATPGPANEVPPDEVFVDEITSGPSHGTLVIKAGDKLIEYTPEVGFEGTDEFTFIVRDAFGAVSGEATATITVEPLTLPRARDDRNVLVDEDNPILIDVLQNDVFNDGASRTQFIVTVAPLHGTAVVSGDQILYTPDADYFGDDSFVYQIDDDFTDSIPDDATVTLTVQSINDKPVAADDDYEFDEDQTQTFAVLDNDDPGAANESQQELFIDQYSDPQFGTLTVLNGNEFQYVPDANFYGTDSFTYRVRDEDGAVSLDAATVSILVDNVNDAPTASNKSFTVLEDSNPGANAENVMDVTSGDLPGAAGPYSDDDGDSISLVRVGIVDGNGVFQDGATSNGGTVAIVAGKVEYTPAANDFGTDLFTYVIEDDFAATATADVTVNITEVNDPPTVLNEDGSSAEEERLLALKDFDTQELDVLANDSITPDEGTDDVLTIKELVGQGADGLLFTPHGTAWISADGLKVLYTPDAGYESNGTFDSFSYIVQDGRGGEAEGMAEIDVIDAVPSDISGTVYVDANGDGVQQPGELTLAGVAVTLTGTNIRGAAVNLTVETDADGVFMFPGVLPTADGDAVGYSIRAEQARYLNDGIDSIVDATEDGNYNPGDAHNDLFTGINLGVWGSNGRAAGNYAFGEAGLASSYIKLTQYLASTRRGLMMATDGLGDTFWFSVLEGWEGIASASFEFGSIDTNQGMATAQLRVVDTNGGVHTKALSYYKDYDFAGDPRDGGVVVFLKGSAADYGFDLSANDDTFSAEGEMSVEAQQLELLAAGNGAQYREGVDAVFGSGDWA